MASGVKADTSKRLGALLLKGWAMLAENCPDCRVPLMRERNAEERLCVNCDTTYIPDGQGLRPTNRTVEQQQQREKKKQEQNLADERLQNEQDDADDDVPYDPRADSRLGPFASPGDGTSAAGAPGAAASSASAPEAGAETATAAQAEPTPADASAGDARLASGDSSARGAAAEAAAGPGLGSRAAAAASAPSTDDVADLLSTKMLQGWALLDKYCPRCSTVLVRSKANKRMFCVACDAWVLTEADCAQQQQEREQRQQAAAPAAAAAAAVAPEAPPAREPASSPAPSSAAPQHPPQPQQPQQHLHHELQASSPPSLSVGFDTRSRQEPPLAAPVATACVHPLLVGQLQPPPPAQLLLPPQPSHQNPHQPQPQLPFMYQQFFLPGGTGAGSGGSSPPHPWPYPFPPPSPESMPTGIRIPQQQQQQRGARQASTSGQAGGNSAPKQPSGTALLMAIGRTVALKMAEAQGLLERTPVLDTERARSYVSLISECLDLLSKLHSLQQ